VNLRIRTLRFALLVPAFALLGGCPPTISSPHNRQHEDALAEGGRHMSHGRYEEAIASYDHAADEASRRVDLDEALFRETRALVQLERYDEAVAILDEVGNRRPVSRRTSRALFDASLIRLDHLNQREQALAGFERVMRETPDDGLGTRSLYYILRDYEQQNDPAGAVAFCTRLQADLGSTTLGDDLLREKANFHILLGDRASARVALEEIVHRYPYPYGQRWDDAITTLAEMDVEDGEPESAVERLTLLVRHNEQTNLIGTYSLPSMSAAQMRIGQIYRDEIHDYEKAEDAFEDLQRKFPRSTLRDDALFEAGAMWLDVGNNPRRGCRILRRVVDDFEVGGARRRAEERIAADCHD